MRLPVNNSVMTSDYGKRILNNKEEFHDGVDFISRESDLVYAVANGIVVYDMDDYEEIKKFTDIKHSGGNYLIIQHSINGQNYFVRYLHLIYNLKAKGDSVKENEVIGKYGNVGYSFGAHLHFDVFDSKWIKINPKIILNEVLNG
jgi:murein DD-endopeptidase MepM/ murein hydrolase activator NlpD